MKGLIFLIFVMLAYTRSMAKQSETLSARGYNRRVGIPLGEEIQKQEEALLKLGSVARITGGLSSALGQIPYQAGVLTNFSDINGIGICAGSLVSVNRVVHAAHCWSDGEVHGLVSQVVLGSITLFFGGTRQSSTKVIMHPQWNPNLVQNDVAVIYLTEPVQFSSIIAPIAMPCGSQLNESFAGEVAVASGFGRTGDTDAGALTMQQFLSHANMTIITNDECKIFYPNYIVESNICVSGSSNTSTCGGDSGGPLAVTRKGQPLLVGITSFGSYWGCTLGYPGGFARVSSFMSFFNSHL